jgi:hypothetical protein
MARGPGQPRGLATKLNEKHLKALDLLELGVESVASVARTVGFNRDYLMDLITGDEKARQTGKLFHAEYNKRMERKDKRIANLIKTNKEKAMLLVAKELDAMANEAVDRKELVLMVKAMAAIAPAPAPRPSASSVSFHNHYSGLSPQEILHEFSRLRGVATGALNTRRIPEVESGGSGDISALIDSTGETEEESEDPLL